MFGFLMVSGISQSQNKFEQSQLDYYIISVRYGHQISFIMPGGYATVGAAAFSGAVTHTISISVIVFELTGQITHCVPVLVAVLISNAVASFLQPSCYDSIILIKKLPYLPDIVPSSSGAYNIFVEDFMLNISDVKYIWYGMTYSELRDILKQGRKLKGFPLVDNPDQMVLLGSIRRQELIAAIEKQIGRDKRLAEKNVRGQEEEMRRKKQDQDRRIAVIAEQLENKKDRVGLQIVDESAAEMSTQRRPSRFAVSMVNIDNSRETRKEPTLPRRGILKQSNNDNSATVHSNHSSSYSPYGTMAAAADKWRYTVQNITSIFSSEHMISPGAGSKKRLMDFDMSPEEQRDWEAAEIEKPVDFGQLKIDPAPFQLPEKSSLLKVHSLFSMLGTLVFLVISYLILNVLFPGVNHAYVTTIGRLIGVVGLKELRKAIEDVNHHHSQNHSPEEPDTSNANENEIGDGIDDDKDYDEKNDNGVTVTSFDSMEASSILSSEKDESDSLMIMKN